jgi:hypothetical protein
MEGRIQIQIRVPFDLQLTFEKKCSDMKRSKHDVVAEMIHAFVEGRLKINPTDTQKEIYL